VGPLEDVRLELAFNYDDIEPTDLGRCGEPYSPLLACDITFGMMAHGLTGVAIAGYDRPEDPWDSVSGIEVGARLEWRVGRFSMALIDFYGYDDSFYLDQNFRYSRNVDPVTGRPRHTMALGSCTTGAEPSCLLGVPQGTAFDPNDPMQPPGTPLPANNAIEFHSVNQQFFAMICATSIGFSSLDRSSCAQSVFNSLAVNDPTSPTRVTIATAVSNLIAGDASGLVFPGLLGVAIPGGFCDSGDVTSNIVCNPLVQLSDDQGQSANALTFAQALAAGLTPTPIDGAVLYPTGLQALLSDEQQALLGCGPFYGTFCDGHGIDLLNAEASVLFQSTMGIEGTPLALTVGTMPTTTDQTFPQPGTSGLPAGVAGGPAVFQGGPICTRYENGQTYVLPGCRGPSDPGYNVAQDGTTTGPGPIVGAYPRFQPFTSSTSVQGAQPPVPEPQSQFFSSEMAILSWNATMALVALSSPPLLVDTTGDGIPNFDTDLNGDGWADSQFIAQDEFDITQPFRSAGCSYAAPGLCGNVRSIGSLMGVQRNTIRAGGNSQFGRRDFLWHGGSEVILRFEKRNVLGFSMDFAEGLTGTNWGLEFTWIPNIPTTNNDELDGISDTDQLNLTIAVDRPTFVNFLNQNRTFFITTQWFMRYTKDYAKGMPGPGPWSALGILNVSTGYFQDRLLPAVTFVYDFRSNSGAVLPSVGYRFTENFSATFGLAIFSGRTERRTAPLTPISLGNRVGRGAYSAHVDRGLSVIRERDEIFLRVKYAF
jgi:hypothetical protein